MKNKLKEMRKNLSAIIMSSMIGLTACGGSPERLELYVTGADKKDNRQAGIALNYTNPDGTQRIYLDEGFDGTLDKVIYWNAEGTRTIMTADSTGFQEAINQYKEVRTMATNHPW